jgi:hypothetical protein
MTQKYKEKKSIIRADNVFAKHSLKEEKYFFSLVEMQWAKQGFKVLWVNPVM